jgi:hypothetical protein
MKRGSLVSIIIYLIVAAVLISALLALFRALVPEPPHQEVEEARVAIAAARDHDAQIYSPRIFREAQNSYDSAMSAWKRENNRFILLRDYGRVRSLAVTAAEMADEATRNTITRSSSLRANLASEINRLKKEMSSFEKFFLSLPLSQEIKRNHAKGKLLVREAEIDLEKENYIGGQIKIAQADDYISGTYDAARDKLEDYFRRYPDWQEWATATLAESRKSGSYAIIVEKIPGLCHLYQGGKEKYTFEAEFGSNWLGDKMSSGDMATPEGMYTVTRKLSGRSTTYHKALMINYPNKTDIQEFNERIRSGQLPTDARIGDMIEIHGDGGKGTNWTQGCVALKNEDIDLLFRYASAGTPVTIIGSTSTLEEFYSTR